MSNARNLANLLGTDTKIATIDIADEVFQANKNLIINGAAQVAQRGDVTGISSNSYGGPDRFRLNVIGLGTFSISQSTTAPEGFANSYKLDCTTADASPAAGDLLRVNYFIEGQDLQSLAYGTSDAKAITLSFYVRSNKTGTYNIQFQQSDNSFKQAVLSYTIDSANTWEFKSITVAGDTAGVINNDNGAGLNLSWVLGAGSNYTSGSERPTYTAFANADIASTQTVNLADSTSNEWYITGVSLEIGDVATPFEHESYAATLQKCQRYYVSSGFNSGTPYGGGGIAMYAFNSNEAGGTVIFPATMRDGPTIRTKNASGNIGGIHRAAVGDVTSGVAIQWTSNAESNKVGFSGLTKSNAWAAGNMLIGVWDANAEL